MADLTAVIETRGECESRDDGGRKGSLISGMRIGAAQAKWATRPPSASLWGCCARASLSTLGLTSSLGLGCSRAWKVRCFTLGLQKLRPHGQLERGGLDNFKPVFLLFFFIPQMGKFC